MKRVMLIGVFAISMASVAFAGGSIQPFSDAGGGSCSWLLPSPGFVSVHVFHVASTGHTASEWSLVVPPSFGPVGATNSPFTLVIGDPINGASISYETCLSGTFLLMSVFFFAYDGTAEPCTYIGIENAQAIDCAQGREFPPGGQGLIKRLETDPCDCDVPVEETTWGGIKALYN